MTDKVKAYFLLDITCAELGRLGQEWISAKLAMMRDNLYVEMSEEEVEEVDEVIKTLDMPPTCGTRPDATNV